jgi:hypothetical protein
MINVDFCGMFEMCLGGYFYVVRNMKLDPGRRRKFGGGDSGDILAATVCADNGDSQ